jgi:hypothetical protein
MASRATPDMSHGIFEPLTFRTRTAKTRISGSSVAARLDNSNGSDCNTCSVRVVVRQ